MSSDDLISVLPANTLVFQLEGGSISKVTLKVTNTSARKVVFKVKTTQPTWYYVRPNQQIVDVGCTEEVAIVLIEAECLRFLEQKTTDPSDSMEKHRFMVQSKAITDEDFDAIKSLSTDQRSNEYTRIWNSTSKEEKKKIILKVDFLYPGSSPHKVAPSIPNRNVLADAERTQKSNMVDDDEVMSSEKIFAELKEFRLKYDKVVEYTVRLTAERDLMVQRLEGTEKELVLSRRKTSHNDSSSNTQKAEKISLKKSFTTDFPLAAVLLASFLSFLFGRYC